MADEAPLDRHDLDALKDWIRAEFKAVDARLDGMTERVTAALEVQERRDVELNDVRHRFVPRETFEAYKDEQARKTRTILVTMAVMGLTIIGLGLQVLSNLRSLN